MGKSKEHSEGLKRRIVDLHKLKKCSFQDDQFKQLYISLIGYVTSLSCCGRRPKLSPPDEREWSRMVMNNLWTNRLKPAINWKLLWHQCYCPRWREIFVVVMDKLNAFWRKVLWDKWDKDELFGHKRCVWRGNRFPKIPYLLLSMVLKQHTPELLWCRWYWYIAWSNNKEFNLTSSQQLEDWHNCWILEWIRQVNIKLLKWSLQSIHLIPILLLF